MAPNTKRGTQNNNFIKAQHADAINGGRQLESGLDWPAWQDTVTARKRHAGQAIVTLGD